MRVVRLRDQVSHSVSFALLDDAGQPVPAIAGFLGHLGARGYSPNTVSAYAHDLLHFERFLRQRRLAYAGFTPVEAVVFLEHLAQVPSRKRTQAVDAVGGAEPILARLAPTSVNRVLVAVSSFFEYLIVSGQLALEIGRAS